MCGLQRILKRTRALVSDPSKWTTGAPARKADGAVVDPWDPRAVRWGVYGALSKAAEQDRAAFGQAVELVRAIAIRKGHRSIVAATGRPDGHALFLKILDAALAETVDRQAIHP